MDAPQVGGLRIIMDVPAFLIVALITYVVFRGIKESRSASNLMVIIKLAVIFLVIVLGAYYVNPQNWTPFTPNGASGILKGVSAVFFAYIGFDAISTTAEECKNPQRDLPRGMIYSLIICTILYVLLALVLTGMIPYSQLNVGDPLAEVFDKRGLFWVSGIISVSAIIATASVLLVFQLGQPRIWMSMSRDGLLPKIFSRIHPVYKTPYFSTILTGLLVGIPALFLNLEVLLALTSIGTLFAFVLVCAGVLVLQKQKDRPDSKFKVPHVSGKYIVPLLFVLAVALIVAYAPSHFRNIFSREGFPIVLMEAMGYGAIPITTAVGGIPYHIKDGCTGFLVPSTDEESIINNFISHIRSLNEERALLKQMSDNCRSYAKENFSKATFQTEYKKLFGIDQNNQ
jgi:amino acid transporter